MDSSETTAIKFAPNFNLCTKCATIATVGITVCSECVPEYVYDGVKRQCFYVILDVMLIVLQSQRQETVDLDIMLDGRDLDVAHLIARCRVVILACQIYRLSVLLVCMNGIFLVDRV